MEGRINKMNTQEKIFTFRGKTIDQLKKMQLSEFAELINSRERRSLIREKDKLEKFLMECEKKIASGKPLRTHWRDAIIVPRMIDWIFKIHSGNDYVEVQIKPQMLGHRLGEFALTRKHVKHSAPGVGATRSSAFLSVK